MTTQTFLFHYGQYVAYIATWLIHGFYIGILLHRFSRARRELNELEKGK